MPACGILGFTAQLLFSSCQLRIGPSAQALLQEQPDLLRRTGGGQV